MHDKSEVPIPAPTILATTGDDAEHLRVLSRSPHPYRRQKSELLEPSETIIHKPAVTGARNSTDATALLTPTQSTPASDSGTEADDEHVLKGLPAPKARLHKGLRGQNEPISGSSTPLLSPAIVEEESRPAATNGPSRHRPDRIRRSRGERIRRRKEVVRRSAEVLLLASLAGLVGASEDAQPFATRYRRGMYIKHLLNVT